MQETKQAQEDGPRLKEMAPLWLEKGKRQWKQTTLDTYQRLTARYVIPLLGECKVTEITDGVLAHFSEAVGQMSGKETLSDGYRKYLCSLVCQILVFSQKQENLEIRQPQLPAFQNDRRKMELPREADLQKLEAWLWEHVGEETCLGILVVMYTGIRIGELCALRWADIDLEEGCLTVRNNLQRVRRRVGEAAEGKAGKTKVCLQPPKTGSSVRVVPLAETLLMALRENQRPPECYLIPGKNGKWTEARTLQYRFAALLKKCGIPRFRFHLLRHVFASRCISSGADMKSLSEVLGHSSTQVTMNVYVHSTLQQKRRMVNAIRDTAALR